MAKKPSPLPNRLARYAADRRSGVVAAVLRPTDGDRSLAEVVWDVLHRLPDIDVDVDVVDVAELTERLSRRPAFTSAEAAGWVVGLLGGPLAHPADADAPADDKLRALEEETIAALGPDATWLANSEHPLPEFRKPGAERGWSAVTSATFDLVVAARGNGMDLVLARVDED